jgi:hypothetical protein
MGGGPGIHAGEDVHHDNKADKYYYVKWSLKD